MIEPGTLATFLVDTGSTINLIKAHVLTPGAIVSQLQERSLQGIADVLVETLGTTTLRVFSYDVLFHVIPSSLPIPGDGVLGDEFFALTNADVKYGERCLEFHNVCAAFQEDESIIIGARETRKVEVFISTPQVEIGILERREPVKGVYFEEVVVRPEKGKATIDVVNDTDNPIIMKIPTLPIIPWKERVNPVTGDLEGGGITSGVNSRTEKPTMGDKLSEDEEIGMLGILKDVNSYEKGKEISESIYESCGDKVDEEKLSNDCYKEKLVEKEKVNNEKINKINEENCEYEVGKGGINNGELIGITIDENLGESLEGLFDYEERIDREPYNEEIDAITNEGIDYEVTYTDFCNVITEVAADGSSDSAKEPDVQVDLRNFSQGLGKNSDGITEPIPSTSRKFAAPVRPYNTRSRAKQAQLPSTSPKIPDKDAERPADTSNEPSSLPPPPDSSAQQAPSLLPPPTLLPSLSTPPKIPDKDVERKPLDKGALELHENKMLPEYKDIMAQRAKVTDLTRSKKLISLPIDYPPHKSDIMNVLKSLFDVVTEIGIESFSIEKTSFMGDIPWRTIERYLKEIFVSTKLAIIVCSSLVKTPSLDDIEEIIREYHSSAMGGHKGVSKTYCRIRNYYFWNNMKEDVRNFINCCKTCQMRKMTRVKPKRPMILTDTPGRSFDKVALDIVGPLPMTRKRNQYILTMQDLLTKFSRAVPLTNISSVTTAEAFYIEFVCLFGAPRAIITDQGRNFISAVFKGVAKRCNVKQFTTTAYHPQSNGSLERSHHVLIEYLNAYVNSKGNDWDTWLNPAMFSYNTSVHEGTKHTPYELVFARIVRLPSSVPPAEEDVDVTYTQYLSDLYDEMMGLQSLAKQNLENSKIKSKNYYDRKVVTQNLQVGDDVFLQAVKQGKFGNTYNGPYKILELTDNNNATIDLGNEKTRKVHVDRLKLYKNKT
ncbi:hypothetical protein M0802_015444 [Mischocyttarus mexicanus]|nr:hypothetical protein M0802_015444 [Mischocyttarus mexicanus]